MYELTLFHQIVSPNGKTVHIFRIGQPNVANKESADFAATGVSPAAKSSSNDLHVTASPRSGSGRVVHIELPSAPAHMLTHSKTHSLSTSLHSVAGGSHVNPSGRALAAAVQVSSELERTKRGLYFEGIAGSDRVVSNPKGNAVSSPSSTNVSTADRVVSGCSGESPRAEWRQQFRLASDTIQLVPDAFQGRGLSLSKARPSTAHKFSSHERALQALPPSHQSSPPPASLFQATDDTATALVKGRSLTSNTRPPTSPSRVGCVTAVVPAPAVL